MAGPITPERIVYGFTTAGEAQISPDGERILYTRSKANESTKKVESQVWVCDRAGGNHLQLTQSGTRNGGARWSPDLSAGSGQASQIAFVSDRVKKAGIFVLPADGLGEAREVTKHNQGVMELNWSPDGTKLAYVTNHDPENPDEEDPKEGDAPKVRVTRRIDYKQDTRGYLNDNRLHLWVVAVESGERKRLTQESYDHLSPQWSPDGRWLGAVRYYLNGFTSQLALVPSEGGAARLIGPEGGVIGLWSFSPDSSRIIYTGDTKPTAQTDFFVYDIASRETRRLTDDLQVLPSSGDVMGGAPAAPIWLDDRQVLFHAARGGASGLYVIDSAGGAVEPVVKWNALHAGLSVDRARRYVAQVFHNDSHFGELSVYDLQTNTQQVITDFSGPVLAETPSARAERIEIERGGRTIEAWLLHPPNFDPSKKYPLIMDIHGGPHGYYGYGFYPWQQVLATNGYLVVYANPRGSGSYGRAFAQDVIKDWGGEDYLDLLAVVDNVLERPYADASRTGIRGYSYGGYMTSWMLGQTDRFQACVCGAPCFDFESFYGTSDIGHYFGELQFGYPPHMGKEAYAKHSPSEFAHRATTPTLIVHGESDERCPIGQGEQLFVALVKAGCKTEFARYPGGDHLFLLFGWPEHRADYWRRELAWFKEHLG